MLSGNLPVQADGVPVETGQGPGQAAEVALPTVRRGSRVKKRLHVIRQETLAWAEGWAGSIVDRQAILPMFTR